LLRGAICAICSRWSRKPPIAALLSERQSETIRTEDVSKAIVKHRQRILLCLGKGQYAKESVPYQQKLQRLLAIYRRDPKARVPDPVL